MVIDERCPRCKHKFDEISIKEQSLAKNDYKAKVYIIRIRCLDCDIDCNYEIINDYEVNFKKFMYKKR